MPRIVIVEPRSSGARLIDRAAERGDDAIVLTAGVGGRRVPQRHLRRAKDVVLVDTNDDAAVVAAARRLHAANPVDAVVPGFEHYVPLAALVADELGLPGISAQAALRLRHKHLMRAALTAAGVDQPRWAAVSAEDELAQAVARVGLPCVVKPVDLSGSLHVRRSATLGEAAAALRDALGRHDPDLDRASLELVVVEELVAGPEYSVEGYVEGGRAHVLAVTKKLLAAEPFFVEVGHIVPGDLSAAQVRPVEAYVRRVIDALGLTLGPFHAEVRLTDRGPLLIEIAARMGGDNIPHLLELARGVDLADITLCCHLGLPVTPPPPPPPAERRCAGVRYFLRPRLERYTDVVVADGLRVDPRVHDVQLLIAPGSPCPGPDSSRGRLGYAVVTGACFESVRTLLDDVDRGTTFRVSQQPHPGEHQ